MNHAQIELMNLQFFWTILCHASRKQVIVQKAVIPPNGLYLSRWSSFLDNYLILRQCKILLENLSMSICGGNSCVCIWLTKEFGWKEETGIVTIIVTLSWLPISFFSIQIWGLSQYIPTMLEKTWLTMFEHILHYQVSSLWKSMIIIYKNPSIAIALPTLAVGHGQLVMPETDRSDMDKVWEGRIWNQTCHLNLQHCIPTSSSIIGRFF